jgi:hypothetical protein
MIPSGNRLIYSAFAVVIPFSISMELARDIPGRRGVDGVEGAGSGESSMTDAGGTLNSARMLCLIAYSTAISTLIIFSVSLFSASVNSFPSFPLLFTRNKRPRFRTEVPIVVKQFLPVQNRS